MVEFHADHRKALDRGAEKFGHPYELGLRHGAHTQLPGGFSTQGARPITQLIRRIEYHLGVRQQLPTRRRQTHPPGNALEQFERQLRLQRADLRAQRGLADMKTLGGTRHMTQLGHRNKPLQLVQLHGCSVSSAPARHHKQNESVAFEQTIGMQA